MDCEVQCTHIESIKTITASVHLSKTLSCALLVLTWPSLEKGINLLLQWTWIAGHLLVWVAEWRGETFTMY